MSTDEISVGKVQFGRFRYKSVEGLKWTLTLYWIKLLHFFYLAAAGWAYSHFPIVQLFLKVRRPFAWEPYVTLGGKFGRRRVQYRSAPDGRIRAAFFE